MQRFVNVILDNSSSYRQVDGYIDMDGLNNMFDEGWKIVTSHGYYQERLQHYKFFPEKDGIVRYNFLACVLEIDDEKWKEMEA